MKSFTNVEQSKKLAEILPIESADMEFMFLKTDGTMVSNVPFLKEETDEPDCSYKLVPCWSLAALINVIPQEIFDGEYIINITEGLDNRWIITYDHHENKHHSYYGLSSGADNLVEGCVEIIIKLHERKLL